MKVAVPADSGQVQTVHWRRLSVKQGAGFIPHHYILIKMISCIYCIAIEIVTCDCDNGFLV